jgi:hypothetical protein
MPTRVQLQRTRGWRKPVGVITVSRPSRFGNPFALGAPHPDTGDPITRSEALVLYRRHIAGWDLSELTGHDLACWCPLHETCHADVLLELANRPGATG